MSTKVIIYYLASLCQGICLILLPGASFIFKSPEFNQLTDSQYGMLFLPEILGSLMTLLAITPLLHRFGRTRIYYAGIAFNFIYLALMSATALTTGKPVLSFWILMVADLFLGAGFGLLITVMNIFLVDLFPEKRDGFTGGLHGTLGIGATLAPLTVNFFFEKGIWVAACAVTAGLLLLILILSFWAKVIPPPAIIPIKKLEDEKRPKIPYTLWLFPLAAFFYGITESILGNWSVTYLQEKRFSLGTISLALSFFWGFMTVGRLGASLLSLFLDARKLYWISPAIILASVYAIVAIHEEPLILWAYVTVGLGCSYFLPLTISLSTKYFEAHRDLLPGFVMAGLMTGVGIGSFGIGWIKERQILNLEQAFLSSMLCVVVSGFIAILSTSPLPPTRWGKN